MVTVKRGKKVFVAYPDQRRAKPKLRNLASQVRHVRLKMLMDTQFPDTFLSATISRLAD